jgi:hypothetical protein
MPAELISTLMSLVYVSQGLPFNYVLNRTRQFTGNQIKLAASARHGADLAVDKLALVVGIALKSQLLVSGAVGLGKCGHFTFNRPLLRQSYTQYWGFKVSHR